MQKEYDSFIRQIHNYERSLGNKKVLVAAGIPDTQENNKIIAAELLKSGKEVCEGNTKIQSELLINERKIILESYWKIESNKKPYMATIIIKGEK